MSLPVLVSLLVTGCDAGTQRPAVGPSTGTAAAAAFDPRTFDWSSVGYTVTGVPALTSDITLGEPGEMLRAVRTTAGSDVHVVVVDAIDAGVSDSTLDTSTGASSKSEPARIRVDRSSINGGTNTAVGGSAVYVTNSYLTSKVDGIDPTGTGADKPESIVEYNRIQGDGSFNEPHNDGIQLWQGGNISIERNWISDWSNSAILLKSDHGLISHVRISENFLEATNADYSLYVGGDGGFGRPQYVTITDNVFGRCKSGGIDECLYPVAGTVFVRSETERDQAVAAHVPGAAAWIVWSGNINAETGKEIVPRGGWRTYP